MSIFQMTMVKRIEIYCSNKNFKATGEGYHQRDLKLPPFYPRTNNNGFKNNDCIVQENK